MLITSFLVVILTFYMANNSNEPQLPNPIMNSSLEHEVINQIVLAEQKIPRLITPKNFIPNIKLNAYQAIAYQKTSKVKTKLLHSILTNSRLKNKFTYVMKKAQELHLPAELALIPVIESEYKNNAVSSAGAGGLWQLMPGTARIFGLSRTERFDTKASTIAALKHFKSLYDEFGNWELAIAAYNAGDGRVSQALHRNPHAKTVQELSLPRETRNYVLSFFQLQKALKSYTLT